MPSLRKSSLPNGAIDTRTPQQKAADTRKANKAAKERKARELQDSLTPHRAKQAAIQVWQPVTGQKQKRSRKEDPAVNMGLKLDAKHAKARRTKGDLGEIGLHTWCLSIWCHAQTLSVPPLALEAAVAMTAGE
ncbi:hypothetical protein BJV78DRAFT_1290271 [Lactifluus subvellereus]|nr:hypothetical protein BJV78DRAFT_1290271 [Lactifluus subvellereus]